MSTAERDETEIADIPIARARHYLQNALAYVVKATSAEELEAAELELEQAQQALREAVERIRG